MSRAVRRLIGLIALLAVTFALRAQTTTWSTGAYVYDGAGNIKSIGTDQYRYDAFGRLLTATVGPGHSQSATYDTFGNIRTLTTNGLTQSFGVDPSSNQLTVAIDPVTQQPYHVFGTYDDAGRLTVASGGVGNSFDYDNADMVTRSTVEGTTRVHLYTVNDERIASVTFAGGVETGTEWTLRDPGGKILRRVDQHGSQWSWKEDYVYHSAGLLAAEVDTPARTLHFFPDHLGTPRLITGNGGTKVALHTYLPFGEEVNPPGQDAEKLKFTGHERDAASLDYMHARYYAPKWGRFLSVDPTWESADLGRPQSWNRYSYVLNNPVKLSDPDGRNPGTAAAGAGLLAGGVAAARVCAANPSCVRLVVSTGVGLYNLYEEMVAAGPDQIDGEIVINGNDYPEAGQHIDEAQAAGQTPVITLDRAGAKERRKEATGGTPTQPNKDRDEYPPAVAKEGGKGASVRHIDPKDNRGAGASMGQQLRAFKDGAKVVIKVIWDLMF